MKQNLNLIQTTQTNTKRIKTLLMTLLLSLFTLISYSQQWVLVDSVRFNGLPYGSDYSTGGTAYWDDARWGAVFNPSGPASSWGPTNGIINTQYEIVHGTYPNGGSSYGPFPLATSQVPNDANGGRFLIYWTDPSSSVSIAAGDVFAEPIQLFLE